MKRVNTSAKVLATAVGCVILVSATNSNITATGGYFTSHALLVAALSLGVFAGARAIGSAAVSGRMALAVLAGLIAGEAYNLGATAERIVTEREGAQSPLRAALKAHDEARGRLEELEHGEPMTARLKVAKAAKVAADEAVAAEARDIRCGKECARKQGLADQAGAEVIAAAKEAEAVHGVELAKAQASLDAHPLPASASPLADRLGVPAWALDLLMAGLLSLGANGLAGVLVALGAPAESQATVKDMSPTVSKCPDTSQTDFDPTYAATSLRFFRDGPAGGSGDRPSGPKRPNPTDGRSGGLSKGQALDDLLARMADGRTVGSQDELAADWQRPKQTVSDWLREWRRLGVLPEATQAGRCKTILARE